MCNTLCLNQMYGLFWLKRVVTPDLTPNCGAVFQNVLNNGISAFESTFTIHCWNNPLKIRRVCFKGCFVSTILSLVCACHLANCKLLQKILYHNIWEPWRNDGVMMSPVYHCYPNTTTSNLPYITRQQTNCLTLH